MVTVNPGLINRIVHAVQHDVILHFEDFAVLLARFNSDFPPVGEVLEGKYSWQQDIMAVEGAVERLGRGKTVGLFFLGAFVFPTGVRLLVIYAPGSDDRCQPGSEEPQRGSVPVTLCYVPAVVYAVVNV